MRIRSWLVVAASAALFSFVALPAVAQETALEGLRAAARANRRDAAAASAYGMALLRAGRYREAEQQLRTAARLSRGSIEAQFDVARVSFARGDYRAARNACRALERAGRDAVLTRVCHARTFLVWNRSARAFEELQAALAAEATNFEALLALGDAHRLRAEVSESESAYRRAIDANPQSAEPHLGLGRLYAAAGRRDDAIAALRRAIAIDATSPEIQYELGRLLGGSAEGRQLLEQAVAGRPEWPEAQVAIGEALLAQGPESAPAAEAAFRAAIRMNARLAPAHSGLGSALAAQNKHEEAEAALRRALEIVPNSPDTAFRLAQLYEATQRNEEAIEQYRQAADLDPRNPRGLLTAANLAIRLRRDVLAAGFLDRLLDQHPNLAAGLALYGDIMKARGDRNAARDYYQRALRGRGNVDRARVQASLREVGGAQPPRRR